MRRIELWKKASWEIWVRRAGFCCYLLSIIPTSLAVIYATNEHYFRHMNALSWVLSGSAGLLVLVSFHPHNDLTSTPWTMIRPKHALLLWLAALCGWAIVISFLVVSSVSTELAFIRFPNLGSVLLLVIIPIIYVAACVRIPEFAKKAKQ